MKPTIILLAPPPLAATWREAVLGGEKPLLGEPGEVGVAASKDELSELVEGDGANQMLLLALSPFSPLEAFLRRESFPRLTVVVAEDPRSSWGDFGDGWTDTLAEIVAAGTIDATVVADKSRSAGLSVYGAVTRFLSGLPNLVEQDRAEWRDLGQSGRRHRYGPAYA